MSRRRRIPEHVELVSNSTVRIVCTGKDEHTPIRFGATSKTKDGREWAEYVSGIAEARDRHEYQPGLEPRRESSDVRRSSTLNRGIKKKTICFTCPACGLDYQRQAEKWRQILDVYRANGIKVLDLSKLPL